MNHKLRLLLLEDRPADAELMLREVRRAGYEPEWKRVETEPDYLAQLGQGWEIILADFHLPQFDGLRALELLKERGLDIPFILVSATIGEDMAVAAMKAGASDYVMKNKLARLGPAVERELRDAGERRERRLAEEALAKSEAKYRARFESSRDALMTLFPPDWKFTSANAATVELFGAKDEREFTARGLWEVSPEQQPDGEASAVKAKRMIATAMERGSHFFDWTHRKIGGASFPATVLLTRVELKGKTGLQATVRDITAQKRAEEALRESRQMLRQILDTIPVRVFWKDRNSVYLGCNRPFLLDSDAPSPEEMIGKTDSEMGWREQAELYRADDRLVMESGQPKLHYEEPQTKPDGRRLWLRTSIVPLRNADGRIVGVLGTYEDITEKKQLEAQFLRAQRLESIGTLASGVAHDLNNILAPILTGVSLLREGLLPAEAEDLLKLIETSAQRGTAVVKQVLTFGRGIAGERVLIQPRHVIKEVLKMARGTFPKLITLASETPPDLWPLLGDATQLHQVLLNLCVNARDAMPQGGTLRLAAQNVRLTEEGARAPGGLKAGPYLLLQVSDTGHGIPPEIIDRIFDPFFTTKEHGQGTGLGLSTVLGIVQSHGGFVEVRSEVGQGTTFEVYLPATPDAPSAAAPAPAALPGGQEELILVVDDEAGIRDTVRRILVKHGYTVVTASHGAEALTQYAQHRDAIRLVLTDLMMPVMDGLALTRRLKQINPQVRIISSTGWGEENRMAALRELGVKQFLAKPFDVEQLLNALHELLSAAEPEPK